MLNPCHNGTQSNLPAFLTSSWLLAPWVYLTQFAGESFQRWVQNSVLMAGIAGAWSHYIAHPIQSRLKETTWLHQSLAVAHLSLTGAIFVLSTFAPTEIIGASVLLAFLVLLFRLLIKPFSFRFTLIDGLVTLFFLTALVSTMFSSYVQTSWVGVVKFSIFGMGYWNFRILLQEKSRYLLGFLGLLVLLGLGQSLIGFHQYINHIQPLATWQDTSINPEDQLTRIFGTLKPYNPNLLAGFLIFCVAGSLGLTQLSLCRKKWLFGIGSALISLLILGTIVLTGSRGSYLSIIAMAVVTFLYLGHLLWHEPELRSQYRLKALWILLSIGTVLGSLLALIALPAIRHRFLSIFSMREDSSNSYRMNVWSSTISMIRDNWLVGIGPGNDTFKQVYGLYMIPGYNALSAYSIFLEIWAEQGVFGFITFLVLLGVMGLKTLMMFYTPVSLFQKVLLGSLLTGIVGSVVYGLFDTIWYRPNVNLFFWFFVAAISIYTEYSWGEQQGQKAS